jgi:ATP sulfurylase
MRDPYVYRGYPRKMYGKSATHAICGVDRAGGAGVLEWCYSEEDAQEMLKEMSQFARFHGLRIEVQQPEAAAK